MKNIITFLLLCLFLASCNHGSRVTDQSKHFRFEFDSSDATFRQWCKQEADKVWQNSLWRRRVKFASDISDKPDLQAPETITCDSLNRMFALYRPALNDNSPRQPYENRLVRLCGKVIDKPEDNMIGSDGDIEIRIRTSSKTSDTITCELPFALYDENITTWRLPVFSKGRGAMLHIRKNDSVEVIGYPYVDLTHAEIHPVLSLRIVSTNK